jgi:hypothetical protein
VKTSNLPLFGFVFGFIRDELYEEQRELHHEEICTLYRSIYVFWVVKSKALFVAWLGEISNV